MKDRSSSPGGPLPVQRTRSLSSAAAWPLVLALLVVVPAACIDRNMPAVAVEKAPYSEGTVYRISQGDCVIAWTVYTTEVNRGVVKHFSRCPLPLAEQVRLLERIMKKVLEEDRSAKELHTLFWGGLMPEQGASAMELPARLALAAHRSSRWDARAGRPVNGDMNGAVRDLANSVPVYVELRSIFKEARWTIAIAGVEKVRVLNAKDLPFYGELKAQGVREWERLPFDAMVWFHLLPGDRPGNASIKAGKEDIP